MYNLFRILPLEIMCVTLHCSPVQTTMSYSSDNFASLKLILLLKKPGNATLFYGITRILNSWQIYRHCWNFSLRIFISHPKSKSRSYSLLVVKYRSVIHVKFLSIRIGERP